MVLIGAGLWVASWIHPQVMQFYADLHPMPLYKLTLSITGTGLGSRFLGLGLVVITGFLLIRLNTRFIFIQDRTHLPLLFFLMLAGSYPPLERLNPVVPASIFLLIALERMLESYRVDRLSMNPFEASILLGIASLFYAPACFFILVIWIAQGLLRPQYWREWIYTLLGFALPYIVLYAYYYLAGRSFGDETRQILSFLSDRTPQLVLPVTYRLFFGYVLLLVIMSSFQLLRVFQAKKILARRAFNLLFWWFLTCAGIFLFVPAVSIEIFLLSFIPVAFILSHYFQYAKVKPWLIEFFFLAFVSLLLAALWLQ